MKDKILYFIQAFYELGTVKSIQEKHDCEIYAIIDVNKYIQKFFLEQQLVKFQKVWYLRDHLLEQKKPDIDYLTAFEKRYGINLWLLAYMDRNFHEYNRYYKFSRDEILSVLEQQCKFYEKLLDEIKPNFAVITIPDYNQNQLLFEMCRSKGITTLILNPSRLGIRCIISKQVDKLDYYDEIIDKYSNHEQKSVEELKDYLKAYSKLTSNFKSGYRASISKKVKSSVRYLLIVCNDKYRKYYVNYGRTRTKILVTETSLFFKKIFREFFINKHLVKEIDTIKTSFIYFPLHLDPEQSTLMGAPYYTDQLNVIINISRSLPVEYSLIVKEHPAQVLNSWRDVSYYKTLMTLPDVKLLHPSVSNDEILKRCSLVITIAGTLGLEAAFYGKPSITFADVIYSGLPSVYRLQSLEELPQAIRNSLKNSSDIRDLNKFVSCVVDNSIEYDYVNLEIASQHRFFKGGFYFEYEIPVKKGTDFIEENKKVFDNLSTEYVKKIIQHKQYSSKNL